MYALDRGDTTRLADAAYRLGAVRGSKQLAALTSVLLADLIPANTVNWIDIDVASGSFRGHEVPEPVPELLETLPPDPRDVPIAGQLIEHPQLGAVKISDIWSDREWRAKPIYADLYEPNRVRYQFVVPVEIVMTDSTVTAIVSVSLTRDSEDFTERDRAVLDEFGRHARRAHHQAISDRQAEQREAAIGSLTPRQHESLRAVADGSTIGAAAKRLGVSAKTLDNHLQAAYTRLGVTSRIAALARLRGE